MIEWLSVWIFLLIGIIIFLLLKIYYLQKSAQEITKAVQEWLITDTNTLITISSHNVYMRNLAKELNKELHLVRLQKQKYVNGDKELKDAVTNISHDLRTPLTAICGYMDLLEKEETSESVSRYLSLIENRIENMKQLTEELFRYSVILSTEEDMEMESVHINAVLEESIAGFYGALTERGIEPVIQITEERIERTLNKAALSRVFSNILNNAVKYSDGDLEIVLEENGTILFSNTASSLNEVQVGKLFDRFYTVETARNSNGLGLAIAKSLVEQMHGRIEAWYIHSKLMIKVTFLF